MLSIYTKKLYKAYKTGWIFPACQYSALLKKTKSLFWIQKKTHVFDSWKQGKSSFIFVAKLLALLASQLFHEIVVVWNVGICLMMKQMIVVLLTIDMEELLLLRKSWIECWIQWHLWISWSSVEGYCNVVWILYCRWIYHRWNRRSILWYHVVISQWIHVWHLLICCFFMNLFVLFWSKVLGVLGVNLRWQLNRIFAGWIRKKLWVHCFVFFSRFSGVIL